MLNSLGDWLNNCTQYSWLLITQSDQQSEELVFTQYYTFGESVKDCDFEEILKIYSRTTVAWSTSVSIL